MSHWGAASYPERTKRALHQKEASLGKTGRRQRHIYEGIPYLREPVDLVVECYSSVPEAKKIEQYHDELREVLNFRGDQRIVSLSHHLAHVYSTFFVSPYKEAAVLVVDFRGSRAKDVTESWPGESTCQSHAVEVGSFYYCKDREIQCIGKQLWDNDRKRPVGLGAFYNYLTHVIFTGRGMEGKVMGLDALWKSSCVAPAKAVG